MGAAGSVDGSPSPLSPETRADGSAAVAAVTAAARLAPIVAARRSARSAEGGGGEPVAPPTATARAAPARTPASLRAVRTPSPSRSQRPPRRSSPSASLRGGPPKRAVPVPSFASSTASSPSPRQSGSVSPASARRRRYAPTAGGWLGESEANVLRVAARGGALSTSFGKTNIAPCTFRWQRGEQIGQGSFGAVYQGLNQDTGALLAIKELQFAESDEMQELESMKEEIDMMRSLDHPHIVRYLGADVRGSTLYIMAEWMAGGSLRSIIDKFGPLQESVIRRYTRQVLDGLAYLHSKRIIHRDIKGANLLVDERGLVKLADFGAAKRLESTNIRQWQEAMRRARDRGSSGPAWSSSPTWAGGEERASIAAASASPVTELEDGEVMLHGTPYFMAPEVIKNMNPGPPSDIWSVGCTVLQLATALPPWQELGCTTVEEVLFKIADAQRPPATPEHLSPALTTFLLGCLQVDQSLRPTPSALLLHPFILDED